MNIVINSNYVSAGSRVCVDEMIPLLRKAGHTVAQNDWDHYGMYDVALFMAPDSQVTVAKKENPQILTGIMDPKLFRKKHIVEAKAADFLVVSSLEQRDAFLSINKRIVIYNMFPDIKKITKIHTKKDTIVIGYHGNKVHLNSFSLHIKKALEELAKKYPIELHAVYNIQVLGKWKKNVPNINIKHIQWSEDVFQEAFATCDIGIVNNLLPIHQTVGKWSTAFGKKFFRYNPLNLNQDDYLVRYKYSTNPGRLYVFSQLGIPVVADFAPSMCQFILDGHSGFLAYSWQGWYTAFEKLIVDAELRNTYANNLSEHIEQFFSREKNFQLFNDFLEAHVYAR